MNKIAFYWGTLICCSSFSLAVAVPITGIWRNDLFCSSWDETACWNAPRPPGLGNGSAAGGDTAIFRLDDSIPQISVSAGFSDNITLGSLDATLSRNGLFLDVDNMTFKQNGGPAQLFLRGRGQMDFGNPRTTPPFPSILTLATDLAITIPDGINTTLHLLLSIQGQGGITFNGNGDVVLFGTNSNTGPYIVNGGSVTLASNGSAIPSDLTINNGDVRAQRNAQFSPTIHVTMHNGSLFVRNETFIDLTLTGGTASGGVMNLLGSPVSLKMQGGSLGLDALRVAGDIQYLGGRPAMIGKSPSMTIDLAGRTMDLLVNHANPAFDLELLNVTFNNGSVRKTGAGTLLLAGNVNIPFVEEGGIGRINNGRVNMGAQSTDKTTITSSPFLFVSNGATLGGFGHVDFQNPGGFVSNRNGGTIAPGSATAIGTLTFDNPRGVELARGGTLLIKVAGNQADRVNRVGRVIAGDLIVQGNPTANFQSVIMEGATLAALVNNMNPIQDRTPSNVVASFHTNGNEGILDIEVSDEAEMGAGEDVTVLEAIAHTTYSMNAVHGTQGAGGGSLAARVAHPKGLSEDQLFAGEPVYRQIDVGRFWAKPDHLPATVYISPIGSWGKVSQINVQKGFNFHAVGGLAGGDYAFNRVGVGAFVGYEWLKGTEACDYGDFKTRSLFGQIYSTFLPLRNRNFFLDLIGGGSRNWYTFNRPALGATAQGKPKGWEYDGYAGLGYNFNFPGQWRLTPLAGIQYIHTEIDSFTETGAGSHDFTVDEFNKRSLRSWAGLIFGGRLVRPTAIWMPEVRGYWQHEFADLSRCLTVSDECLGVCKNLQIFTGDRNYGIVGAELRALFGPKYRWLLSGAYDYFWSRHFSVNNVYATLGFNF